MREKKKNRIEILEIAMVVLLISGVCMIPCFKTGLPYGDDQQVHMLRVESILKALKSGQGYPVYIYTRLCWKGMATVWEYFTLICSCCQPFSSDFWGHHRRLQ